ncbi:MAG: DUF1552 domain-containing protein [Myxococcota bacterium]
MNRRMFLRTAGGAAVTIPVLGSLLPAHAAEPSSIRFVAMATQHGGIWGEHMWPTDATLNETQDIGHTIRRGDLSWVEQGGDVVLSQVLTARGHHLTPSVRDQLALIRGVDVPFYISHHTGGYLGNYGRNDTEFETDNPVPYHPTIDQVMAWSEGFYGSLLGVTQRSVHIGHPMSWGYANPVAQAGDIDPMPTTWHSTELFASLFGTGDASQGEDRRLVVDQVLESYRRLREGAFGPGRRLSQGDRTRLDAHMERLFEVERRLTALGSCGEVPQPPLDTDAHPGAPFESFDLEAVEAYHELWIDVLALALICGATRIATYNCLHTFEPWVGDWHQDIAHEAWVDLDAEQHLVRGHQRFFDQVFCELASRLDVPDSDGNTVLNNSLLVWMHESGPATHDMISTPVITAGGASGAWRTGQYVDYRNRESRALGQDEYNPIVVAQRPGLLHGQLLGSLLRAVGVPDHAWQRSENPGFGPHRNDSLNAWPRYVEQMANDPLPFFG